MCEILAKGGVRVMKTETKKVVLVKPVEDEMMDNWLDFYAEYAGYGCGLGCGLEW